jgi:phosphoribosylformylglycinamidine synthase I
MDRTRAEVLNVGLHRTAAPCALVLTGYGINCDYETAHACELAGFRTDRVHLNDVIGGQKHLFDYKLLVFPGGFSYGDDLGSGVAFSSKIRLSEDGRLFDALMEYVQRGGLVLGICNGFQILVRLGIIPALGERYGEQQVTLAPNRQGYFIDRWVELAVELDSRSVFTRGLKRLRLPVRHGEGRLLVPDEGLLGQLERGRRVVLRYCDRDGRPTQEFPRNPNGSLNAIAGICDSTGRVFGLMPHPEAALSFYRYPDWMSMRERAKRAGQELSEKGDGCSIFERAFSSVG